MVDGARRNVGVVRETSQQNVRDMMKLDHAAGPILSASDQNTDPAREVSAAPRIAEAWLRQS